MIVGNLQLDEKLQIRKSVQISSKEVLINNLTQCPHLGTANIYYRPQNNLIIK